ncbi:hypothetical protein BJ165DRAFT_1599016 [Panaeolus papilionaceus]|nr:hypothetical protein BJ165DRAFT_1599016 [Panaeolus papilionaceus]
MDLTPPGAPTLTHYAAFHGRSLSLGVVHDPVNLVVGGGRSIVWGGAMTEIVSHPDAIKVWYGGGKKDRILVEMEVETNHDDGQKAGMRRGLAVVGATDDLSEIFPLIVIAVCFADDPIALHPSPPLIVVINATPYARPLEPDYERSFGEGTQESVAVSGRSRDELEQPILLFIDLRWLWMGLMPQESSLLRGGRIVVFIVGLMPGGCEEILESYLEIISVDWGDEKAIG